jgi:hypothetical protein
MSDRLMDEAFVPMHEVMRTMLAFNGEFVDHDAGVHSYITACSIESPVELNVFRDETGVLQIGTTPPLYNVRTSVLPSFHQLRFHAERTERADG